MVLKLRTMRVQSDNAQNLWTQPGDRRITSVGMWLRRLRIDELPHLLNVLNGEMSLIGPRPERPELEHDLRVIYRTTVRGIGCAPVSVVGLRFALLMRAVLRIPISSFLMIFIIYVIPVPCWTWLYYFEQLRPF